MRKLFKFWIAVFISSFLIVAALISGLLACDYLSNTKDTQVAVNTLKENTKISTEENSVKLPRESSNSNLTEKKEAEISNKCLPAGFKFSSEVIDGEKILKEYRRNYEISFPAPQNYTLLPGITCFRGNHFRNSASYGLVDMSREKLEKVWFSKTGYIDTWTGIGWNGQPAIVKWEDNIRNLMNLYPEKKQKTGLREVIYAALDGKIYFMDLDDGKPTRPAIDVGAPHKGSVTVDPRGYPLLYAGQGIDEVGGNKVNTGYRIFNLINQKILYFINGYDKYAFRLWGAFDSTPLIDSKTDTFIECGENGLLYTLKLNTQFDSDKKDISIHPEVIKYRYESPKNSTIGTENSVAIYKNYSYFLDNSGTLQCVDLNTLKPVWIRDVTDDSDSTLASEEEGNSRVSLYTACEVDKQGEHGFSYIRKINALTGELLWEKSYPCFYDIQTNGGVLASPVIGKKDIQNLVIFNIARTGSKNGGKLIAFDKKTGKEVWVVDLELYCWSSPVDVYTKKGKSYLVVCDSGGNMNLFDGISGKRLDKVALEANIEGSPAVYDNMIVVGTRGQKIWGIRME